jgi:hypothetical protein
LANIYNLDQYVLADGKMYVKNRKVETYQTTFPDGKIQYYQDLFQNGDIKTYYYDRLSDIPTYLVIDYISGETVAYKSIADVPPNEKQYFEGIENK